MSYSCHVLPFFVVFPYLSYLILFIIYTYLPLWSIIYHFFQLFAIISHYFPLFTSIYDHLQLSTTISICLRLFTIFFPLVTILLNYLPLFSITYHYFHSLTNIYHYLPLLTRINHYLPVLLSYLGLPFISSFHLFWETLLLEFFRQVVQQVIENCRGGPCWQPMSNPLKTVKGRKIPNNMVISDTLLVPIGSMYAIYGNIDHQYTPNVSINLPYMDPMGYK